MNSTKYSVVLTAVFFVACAPEAKPIAASHVESLDELAIESLRDRTYGSRLTIEKRLANEAHETVIAAYESDGLRIYSRIDVPADAAPANGYPVVIFVHGWMGVEAAPNTDFYFDDDSSYDRMIRAYVTAGFVVMTPGWRGHGTVNDRPADGIEYMTTWDNATYLSPVFYAIDVLNLLDSLSTYPETELNLENVNMVSHSQGGDVALIALAVAGEGSRVANEISSASFWSGCFPSRATQFLTYQPMQKSPQAFVSGDGTWNGTAVGADGEINGAFVFGFPADWIATPHRHEWTWQNEMFSAPTVADVLADRLKEMYDVINSQVNDIGDASFELRTDTTGATTVVHDSRIAAAMARIDAFDKEAFLSEAINLQHSDRDFYSLPEWNADLCARINAAGGECHDFEYKENTHSLSVSEHRWFSDVDAVAGFQTAIERDIALFRR